MVGGRFCVMFMSQNLYFFVCNFTAVISEHATEVGKCRFSVAKRECGESADVITTTSDRKGEGQAGGALSSCTSVCKNNLPISIECSLSVLRSVEKRSLPSGISTNHYRDVNYVTLAPAELRGTGTGSAEGAAAPPVFFCGQL